MEESGGNFQRFSSKNSGIASDQHKYAQATRGGGKWGNAASDSAHFTQQQKMDAWRARSPGIHPKNSVIHLRNGDPNVPLDAA